MADDKILKAKVTIDSDVDGLKRVTLTTSQAEKAVKELNTAVKKAGSELRDAGRDAERFADEMDGLERAAGDANRELKETGQASSQAGADIQALEREIRRAEQRWTALNSATIAAKVEYKQLRDVVGATREDFERQGQVIKAAEKAELAAIETTRDLIRQHNALSGAVDDSSGSYGQLGLRLNDAEGWIDGVDNKARMHKKSMDGLTQSVSDVAQEVHGLGGIFQEAMGRMNISVNEILVGAAVAGFNLLIDSVRAAGQHIVEFVNESNEQFEQFDRDARQAFTLIPGMSAAMKQSVSADLREMGKDIGRVSDEYLPAMYQALSLGIPKDNSLDAIRIASEAARAANADLTPTLVTGQSIVNAYGGELYNLNRVYDLLFYAVKNGAVTIEQLNAGMSEITSVAGEVNVPLEDIVSAIIVMTKQGDSFEEVSGLLSNMLTQLSISGTALGGAFRDAAGKDFRTFIDEGGNLAQALQLIQDHVKDTGQTMTEVLGGDSNFYRDQQAMRGALELTGKHMDEFLNLSLEAVDAQGLVAEAGAEMAGSMSLTAEKTAAANEAMEIQIGQYLAPARREWLELKLAVAGYLGELAAVANNDYGAGARAAMEQQLALASSQAEVIALTREWAGELAAAEDAGKGAADDINDELVRVIASFAELAEVNEEDYLNLDANKFYAVRDALQAVYGSAISVRDGYILLDGVSIGYGRDLYDLVAAHQEQAKAAATAAEAEAELNRITSEAAGADAVLTRNAGLWNGVEAATQLVGLLSVLDGDTIRVDLGGEIQDVRFKNVNAPEIAHGEEAAMPWAYQAQKATQRYFDQNPVELGATLDRESYDRIIAGFPELERELVSRGLAIPLPATLSEDPELFAELSELAKEAAAAGEGMFEDQALAARVLNGEMVDLGEYYEELAEHQGRVNAAFDRAAGPVGAFYDALDAVAEVPAWNTTGIMEAKDAVLAANEEIIASHRRLAYETYLAQHGVTQATIDIGVAMGIYTEAEGEKRLAFANTQAAITELITQQADLKLSDEELIAATELLISGMANTPAAAAEAVKGLGNLEGGARNARGAVKEAHDALLAAEGDYHATFTTENVTINKTYNKTYNEEYTSPVSKTNPNNKAGGGRLVPGVPYLVGDDPNGALTPYSELFVPDSAGYLLNSQQTRAVLGDGGGATSTVPSQLVHNHFYSNSREAMALALAQAEHMRRKRMDSA